jgi:uncharacterized protein YukE
MKANNIQTVNDLNSFSNDLMRYIDQLNGELNALNRKVTQLSSSWQGSSSTEFVNKYNEVLKNRLNASMNSMRKLSYISKQVSTDLSKDK